MVYLLWGSLFGVTYVCGRGFLTVTGGGQKKEDGFMDAVLAGFLICIGIAEAAYLVALFGHRSFGYCIRIMELLYGLTVLGSLGILIFAGRRRTKTKLRLYEGDNLTRTSYYLIFLTIVVIVIQFVIIQVNEHVYLDGDLTVETVNTFLYTDQIYKINPLTGEAYQAGVPMRLRILGLPAFYAFLTAVFRMNAIEVVWKGIPAFVLLCAYAVLWGIAKQLFPKDRTRRSLFLLFAAFILTVGNYPSSMDGFMLLRSGFRGTAIRNLVLVPYTIQGVLRGRKTQIVLCILAEACITWTFYGAGVCLFVAAGLLVAQKVMKRAVKKA